MEVICIRCKTKLNVPDEKVPEGQRVSLSCPKCKNKITLGMQEPKRKPSEATTETKSELSKSKVDAGYGYDDEDTVLDLYEDGAKLALVMEQDTGSEEKVKRAIEELGYRHVPAGNTRQGIGRMRFHLFDLVILSDQFDGIELAQSPILHYLNHLSMSIRRKIFVTLVGDGFKTMDQMMAFSLSVNLVINRKDLDKLTAILKRAVADNEKFYKVFKDSLAEIGKV